MKVSVCGKGGSGKSTIVTLLANEIRDRGYHPLVVDSDESNSVLYWMLGFHQPPIPLVELAGGRKMVRKLMPPKYAPGESERGTHVLSQDKILLEDIPHQNMIERDNIRLVIIGKILQPLEGCACPMGVLSREFLGKLQLKGDEIAIVDMEAGIEHFGRGVETNIDSILIVVEPSLESIILAEKVKHLATGVAIDNIWAVLNKVNSDDLALKLTNELARRGVAVAGSIPYDADIFEACLEGVPLAKGKTTGAVRKIVDFLLSNEKRS